MKNAGKMQSDWEQQRRNRRKQRNKWNEEDVGKTRCKSWWKGEIDAHLDGICTWGKHRRKKEQKSQRGLDLAGGSKKELFMKAAWSGDPKVAFGPQSIPRHRFSFFSKFWLVDSAGSSGCLVLYCSLCWACWLCLHLLSPMSLWPCHGLLLLCLHHRYMHG